MPFVVLYTRAQYEKTVPFRLYTGLSFGRGGRWTTNKIRLHLTKNIIALLNLDLKFRNPKCNFKTPNVTNKNSS